MAHESLNALRSAVLSGLVTKEEVSALLLELNTDQTATMSSGKDGSRIAHILYGVGGLVLLIGLVIFVNQHWSELSSTLRILLTLGSGLAFYSSSVLLWTNSRFLGVGSALHAVAGFLIPGGILVTLNELGFRDGRFGLAVIFLALTALLSVQYQISQRVVSLLFAVLYGTMTFGLFTDAIVNGLPLFDTTDYHAYRLLVVGISYALLGFAWRLGNARRMSAPLYFFGAPAILGATMILQGFQPDQSLVWEVLYPGIVLGLLMLSAFIKSRSFLYFSAIFLIGFIAKITAEYFADDLSWPIMLMLSGFLVMGVGYGVYALQRKYLRV